MEIDLENGVQTSRRLNDSEKLNTDFPLYLADQRVHQADHKVGQRADDRENHSADHQVNQENHSTNHLTNQENQEVIDHLDQENQGANQQGDQVNHSADHRGDGANSLNKPADSLAKKADDRSEIDKLAGKANQSDRLERKAKRTQPTRRGDQPTTTERHSTRSTGQPAEQPLLDEPKQSRSVQKIPIGKRNLFCFVRKCVADKSWS